MTSQSQFTPAKWERSLCSIFILSITRMNTFRIAQISLTRFRINFTCKVFLSCCFYSCAFSWDFLLFSVSYLGLSRFSSEINFYRIKSKSFPKAAQNPCVRKVVSSLRPFSINLLTKSALGGFVGDVCRWKLYFERSLSQMSMWSQRSQRDWSHLGVLHLFVKINCFW